MDYEYVIDQQLASTVGPGCIGELSGRVCHYSIWFSRCSRRQGTLEQTFGEDCTLLVGHCFGNL